MRRPARASSISRLSAAALTGLALLAAPTAGLAQGPPRPERPASVPVSPAEGVRHAEGKMANGNLWVAEVPANWNGVLILDSHGYSPGVRAPSLRRRGSNEWLLKNGYALAASSYSKGGWSLAEAVPDQIATLDEVVKQFGKPKRTIAVGGSMGGLVSVALVERHPDRFDAAIPSCGSISGSLGMMNMSLDGGFAFKTLIAPASDVQIVHVTDDEANGALVRKLAAAAQATPEGRARLALAATLAQLPPWVEGKTPPADFDAQEAQQAGDLALGGFLPRAEQEQRAGGVFSWNTGIDYRKQLALSGRRDYVEALYKKAGLSLEKDLATLNAAPRIAADPGAVAYMRANYVPSGKTSHPVFSFHTIGDGMTMVTKQGAYRDAVRQAGRGDLFAGGWVNRAGHCNFSDSEMVAAIQTVEDRLATGRWTATPEALNARAKATGLGESAFVPFTPAPFLRPCTGLQASCAGEPAKARRKG